MRKRSLAYFVVIFCVGLLIWIIKTSYGSGPKNQIISAESFRSQDSQNQNSIDPIERPVKLITIFNKSSASTFKEDLRATQKCNDLHQTLAGENAEKFLKLLKEKKIVFDESCKNFESKDISQNLIQSVYTDCGDVSSDEKIQKCSIHLWNYRAQYLTLGLDDSKPEALTDQQVVQSFFKRLLNPSADNARMKSLTRELVVRFPNSPGAAKADVIPQLFEAFKEGSAPSFTKDFFNKLLRARQMSPSDSELFELQLVGELKTNPSQAQDSIDQFIEKNPKNYLGYYYKAGAAWERKDIESTSKYLDLAKKYSPNDERVLFAINEINSEKKEAKNPFSVRVGFNPENL